MANSTFSGPIRSESTVKTVSKNSSTGAITEIITMGDAPVALGDEDKTLTLQHTAEECLQFLQSEAIEHYTTCTSCWTNLHLFMLEQQKKQKI